MSSTHAVALAKPYQPAAVEPGVSRYTQIPSTRLIRIEGCCPSLSPEIKSFLWKSAAVVAALGYVFFAAAGVVLSGGNVVLPMLITALTLDFAYKFCAVLWSMGDANDAIAEADQKVLAKLKSLEGCNVHRLLNQMGIPEGARKNYNQLSSPKEILPLIARYKVWEEEVERLTKEYNKIKDSLAEDPSREKVAESIKAYEDLYPMLQCARLQAAYFFALLHNPCFRRELRDIGMMVSIPMAYRAMANTIGQQKIGQEIFRFFNERKDSITVKDLETGSAHQKILTFHKV